MSEKQILPEATRPLASVAKRSIPGVGLVGFVRQLPDAARDPLTFLQTAHARHGDFCRLVGNIYLVSHPDYIEQVLVSTNRGFIKGINKPGAKPRTFAGNGLVVSEGDFWLRQRRMLQPAFHRQRIAGYAGTMVDYTAKMLNEWQPGETYNLQEQMANLTLQIVGKTLFDADMCNEAETLGRLLAGFAANPVTGFSLSSKKRKQSKQAQADFDAALYRLIAERRTSGDDNGDLLSMLLTLRDDDNSALNDTQIRDELITMITAGHETTALALTWIFYLLGQNEAVRRKLTEEINSVLGDRSPELSDLSRLVYADAVIKEGLRLYPPTWGLARRVTKAVQVGEYSLKKGSFVVVSPWLMHRSARYFERPAEFCPERWLPDAPGVTLEKKLPKYAYFPFGGGPRVCIGQSFAQLEMLLVLVLVARRYRLEPVRDFASVRPKAGVTLRPDRSIFVHTKSV
jgi:cytochrome P450